MGQRGDVDTSAAGGQPRATVGVELGSRRYDIIVGAGVLDQLGRRLADQVGRIRVALISDETVAELYGPAAAKSLAAAGLEHHLITVAPGESSKSAATLGRLYDGLFDCAAERRDVIVALGGGVVGDLAGFAAATFKRGLALVQVPTTLLAMVDSSVGGKTGINHPRGKNMIGAFHQPRLVLADIMTLRTLPRRELGCGLAESVKHGVIRDAAFLAFLEAQAESILALDPAVMTEMVTWNCRIKAAVVTADEREGGLRGILNLGHTVGHTLETVLPGHPYHHGEAVALGMVVALRLACEHGLMIHAEAERVIALLARFGLPTSVPTALPIDELYAAMLQDKKVKAGKVNFVLPTGIGSCTFANDVTEAEVKAAMAGLAN